jgi:hypothetical protein
MADSDLPDNSRAKIGFHKAIMGAITAYSAIAIFEIATTPPNLYNQDEPFELKIAAVFFLISFTFAVSQLLLLYRIDLKDRQKEHLEAFRRSDHYSSVFVAALIAAFGGTCVLLIQIAAWLVIPLAISVVFLIWFLNWQEAKLNPSKAIPLTREPTPPTSAEDKD